MRPIKHGVVIKPFPLSDTYKSTIAIPQRMYQPSNNGIIMRIGPLVSSVKIGEWALFNWRQAEPFGEEDHVVIHERGIYAILADPTEVSITAAVVADMNIEGHKDSLLAYLRKNGVVVFDYDMGLVDFEKKIKDAECLVTLGSSARVMYYIGYARANRILTFVNCSIAQRNVETMFFDHRKDLWEKMKKALRP